MFQPALEAAAPAVPRTNPRLWMVTAAMTVVAGVALWGWLKPAPASQRPLIHFATATPQGIATNPIAVSSDGLHIAFKELPRTRSSSAAWIIR